jgi:hypothetical protein
LLRLLRAGFGTSLPKAHAAACPQLAKADFASSSQHVREGQRIAALDAEIDARQWQALALGAESQEATLRRGSGCNRSNGEPRRFPTKV